MSVPTEPGFYYVKWPGGTVWTICEVDSEMNVWVLGSDHARYERDMEGWVWGPRIPEFDPDAIPIEKFVRFAGGVIDKLSQESSIRKVVRAFARQNGLIDKHKSNARSTNWPKLEGEG